jgi:hypothetical protein
MSTHLNVNSKSWVALNKLRKIARHVITNQNRAHIHRAKNKERAQAVAEKMLADFDKVSKIIKNRQISLLDEVICDFVIDHIYDIDNQESKVVARVMEFYEAITQYRA